MNGGVEPGGIWRTADCETAVIWLVAASTLAPGCKKTLMMARPPTVKDSMCSMLLTVVVRFRSKSEETRPSMLSASRPPYDQTTTITGISIFGKKTNEKQKKTNEQTNKITSASTTKVYGRVSATR